MPTPKGAEPDFEFDTCCSQRTQVWLLESWIPDSTLTHASVMHNQSHSSQTKHFSLHVQDEGELVLTAHYDGNLDHPTPTQPPTQVGG